MKIKTDNIFQVIELENSVEEAYKALTDAALLSRLTGMTAQMDSHEGGTFHAWNNKSHGYIMRLIPNQRIVQSWRHDEFPDGMYSIVIMDIEKTDTGCRVSFNHIGVPEDCSGWLTETWKKDFWIPLSEHLGDKVLN
ncbi:MAG: SRPBCC domain-containing protein [Flavobacteriales bacterium]|nr:SRPBCC domain-containing protein [Flavobacteriales bacterium]